MPLVDMSVEQLFKYQGVSPCPKDIDEYWDTALAEMNAVNHNAEFIKKEFSSKTADIYDLYYTGTKNVRIHAKVAVPKNEKGKMPAVLMFTGLMDTICPRLHSLQSTTRLIRKKMLSFILNTVMKRLKARKILFLNF